MQLLLIFRDGYPADCFRIPSFTPLGGGTLADLAAVGAFVFSPGPGDKNHAGDNPEKQQNDGDELPAAVVPQPRFHLAGKSAGSAAALPRNA